jgi:thiamine biosynthesis lipoprotein ApbE
VTVVARDAATAEAHATALAIAAVADAAAHVAAHPEISALYLPEDGEPVPLGSPPLAHARILVRAA